MELKRYRTSLLTVHFERPLILSDVLRKPETFIYRQVDLCKEVTAVIYTKEFSKTTTIRYR